MAGHWGNWAARLPGWSAATSAITTQPQAAKPEHRTEGFGVAILQQLLQSGWLKARPAPRVWTGKARM